MPVSPNAGPVRGDVFFGTGDAAGALPELEELLQLGSKALAPDSPWLARYRDALARCQEELAKAKR